MANRLEEATLNKLSDYGIDKAQVKGLKVGCYEVVKLDKPDKNGFTHDLIDTCGRPTNCRCLVIAPTLEEAQRLIDETDPESSGYTGTHLWLNSKFTTLKKYEIGGQVVRMTEQQAEDWNEGNITEETMRGAIVYIPYTVGDYWYVRDGWIIYVPGLPVEDAIDLWDACEDEEFYDEWLCGFPANPVA